MFEQHLIMAMLQPDVYQTPPLCSHLYPAQELHFDQSASCCAQAAACSSQAVAAATAATAARRLSAVHTAQAAALQIQRSLLLEQANASFRAAEHLQGALGVMEEQHVLRCELRGLAFSSNGSGNSQSLVAMMQLSGGGYLPGPGTVAQLLPGLEGGREARPGLAEVLRFKVGL